MEVLKNFFVSGIFTCLLAFNLNVANALSVAYPANGLYSLQPQCAPGKELTVENASTNNGANVFLWSINSNWHTQPSHQKWYIERIGNSEWYIIKAENSGKCLNVDGGAAKDFTNITLWQRTDENQTFRFFDAGNGNYIIQGHTHGGFFVLDVYYAKNADGTNVTNCGYNGSPAQIWKLVRRNPSSQGSQQQQNNSEFSWPIPGCTRYSYRNNHSCRHYYSGKIAAAIDISADVGTPIYAPANGVVQNKGVASGFGNWFEIKHDDGTITLYAHLSDYSMVWNGKRVNKGELIAKSGNTGKSTGPHLHFEMYNPNNSNMRPDIYFKSRGVIGNSSY